MVRKTTDKIIEVIVNGTYADVENNIRNYRVKVCMPDCIDEWIMANIKNRYILATLKKGKEFLSNGKEANNLDYLNVASVKRITIEEVDDYGKSLIVVTDRLPSFYEKSLFNFSFLEIQDFSTAFGLHKVQTTGSIEKMKKTIFLEYLEKVKGLSEAEIKDFSFYKYDKVRKTYTLELTDEEKNNFIIKKRVCLDSKQFDDEDIRIVNGNRSLLDLLDKNIPSKKSSGKSNLETSTNFLTLDGKEHNVTIVE
jgi:hypothetical protein